MQCIKIGSPHIILLPCPCFLESAERLLHKYTPEAVGDYVVGTNHVLPTMQTARFSSGLSVQTFMKRTSVVECGKSNFNEIAPSAITIAEQEGLKSHADSLRARLNRKDD